MVRLLAASALATQGASTMAQDAPESDAGELTEAAAAAADPIIITGTRLRGSVDSDIPPDIELGEEAVASYGASSIEDLLDAIAPQTGSARGRGGGGRPIILLNGQRISGFRELRDLPPEAIERVQVFPEELALEYGYRPDQRVVNFILKDNFAQLTGEVEAAFPTGGGFAEGEVETTYTRITGGGRLNVDLEYRPSSSLTEAERGIVQESAGDLDLADEGEFRTLVAESDTVELNANWSGQLSEATSLTLSGEFSHDESRSLLGLADVDLTIPADSPFARTDEPEEISRLLPASGALTRESRSDDVAVGGVMNGRLDEYRWSLTANYSRSASETETEREAGTDALTAVVAAGDPAVDPFDPDLGSGLLPTVDTSESVNQTVDLNGNISGAPLLLPAGELRTSLTAGYNWLGIDSESVTNGTAAAADLGRSVVFARANMDIPLTSVREGVLDAVGDISVNGNLGYSELSDFGGLYEYGYGLRWEPVDGLSFLASVIGEEAAPSVSQLGDPIEVTPNVTTFDLATGKTVRIDRTTGGNPDLLAESRRDLKLTLNWSPGGERDRQVTVEYIRNHSEDVTSSFPLLTPAIETAFPDRVTRDASGQLVALDARPITLSEVDAERLRYGFSLRGEFDQEEERGRGRGGPPMPGSGPSGGRWSVSAYHTWSLDETVLIRPGLDELDLLNGDVIGGGTPTARHNVEVEGGVFWNGMGLRADATYTGTSEIAGSGLPGSSDLFFGDLLTVDLRAFYNFESNEGLIEDVPFLKGARMSLSVDNLFGGIRRVEDETGAVPLSYQPGYLDPEGRMIEIEFRKRF
ncbi:hypothetical protein B5C34_05635 [Pacificimonas flava]|uniref:TonB-dependent receptor n=2 Tax=Pacificimonas TaxID=1960290 RepID=A0A219B3M7_9SPHN|nr:MULTISPECIES: hypothetical protein [Pacificimonas]MBZ6377297.1 hypothetical protein [Pacificimonas aurantium]OWV32992.1 hypothetical protein B5C34_05635 [Pacificimonas flava]